MSVNPPAIPGYEDNMTDTPRALLRALGKIVTAKGDLFVLQCGAEDVRALRQALSDGFAGVALAGCRDAADVQRLAVLLSVAEAEEGRPDGATPILAVTDGILSAPTAFRDASSRLMGLAWDAGFLAQALGAPGRRTADGDWAGAFAAARAGVLLAAAVAGVPAYDSPSPLTGEAFLTECRRSRDDGFSGRLADDAGQVEAIESLYGQGRSISKTSDASV